MNARYNLLGTLADSNYPVVIPRVTFGAVIDTIYASVVHGWSPLMEAVDSANKTINPEYKHLNPNL